MAEKMTAGQMREILQRIDEAKATDTSIPQSYIDRLERAVELLAKVRKMPAIDWDNLSTLDEVERAEGEIHLMAELRNEIERHFNTCGLTVSGKPSRGGKETRERQRAPRRTKDQMAEDSRLNEITKAKRKELNLPARGRLNAADKAKLDAAVEKALKSKTK